MVPHARRPGIYGYEMPAGMADIKSKHGGAVSPAGTACPAGDERHDSCGAGRKIDCHGRQKRNRYDNQGNGGAFFHANILLISPPCCQPGNLTIEIYLWYSAYGTPEAQWPLNMAQATAPKKTARSPAAYR